MKTACNLYGPWSTSLDNGTRLELSAFWRRRMASLPRLAAPVTWRRSALGCAAVIATVLTTTPLLEFRRAVVLAEEAESKEPTATAKADSKPAKGEGSDFLRRLEREAAPHLKALQEQHGYTLAEGEFLKRIPPPFPEARMAWYRAGNPGQAESIPKGPDSMLFRLENGGPRNWGMSFGGYDVADVLEAAAGVYPQFIDGPENIRKLAVPGDWIVRADAPAEKIVADLERILNRDFSAKVRLRFVETPLEVFVARGRYKHTALEGQRAVDETQLTDRIARADIVHIFGEQFNPNSGAGGGLGHFNEFCSWLGEWIGAPVVSDLEQPPGGEISWRLHNPSPYTDEQRAKAHDAKLVLANVAKQTGLEFVREKRPVRMLVIDDDLGQSTLIKIGDSFTFLSDTSPGEVLKAEGYGRIDPRFLQAARRKDSSR
jgi:hypothetical protein